MQRHDWSSANPKEPMLHLSLSPWTGSRLQLASSSIHWCLHIEQPQAQHLPTSTHYYESTSPPESPPTSTHYYESTSPPEAPPTSTHYYESTSPPEATPTSTHYYESTSPPEAPPTSTHYYESTSPPEALPTFTHYYESTSPPEAPSTSTHYYESTSPPEALPTFTHYYESTSPPEAPSTSTHYYESTSPPEAPPSSTHYYESTSPPEAPPTSTNYYESTSPPEVWDLWASDVSWCHHREAQNHFPERFHSPFLAGGINFPPPSGMLNPWQSSSNNWKLISSVITRLDQKKKNYFLNFALFPLTSPCLASICSEQCLEMCMTSTSCVCVYLFIMYRLLYSSILDKNIC